MAERILQESEEIRPGDSVTVFFKPWWVSADTVKAEIVRVFSGTIFPVDLVTVSLFGVVAFSGRARGQQGLFSTLPGRNITAAEFRTFVNSRLALISGASGDVEVDRIVAGEQAAANEAPGKVWVYVVVGLGALAVIAYLVSSVGKVGALVKP